MKLCTVIAYYIASITKQLKFLNSHCYIVCGYCSVVCLIAKSELKHDQIFKFFKLNEIHLVDSPFNEDPKTINFSREALISWEGRPENLRKMAITGTSIIMQIGGGQFQKRTSVPTPWYQTPCDASIFLHARPNVREKMKNSTFRSKFDLSLLSSIPKI